MERTKTDEFSKHGIYRIYDKQKLTDRYSRVLHEGGPWFIEPKDWDHSRPWQAGFPSFDSAMRAADYLENEKGQIA